MNKKLEEIILQIALEDYESGYITASDKESFNKILKDDFNVEVGDEAFDFYAQCRNMGPSGFYLMYKDELDFSPEFKAEYGFEENEVNESKEAKKLIKEKEENKDSFRVQEIDKKGNKLDQFINFATAQEAIAFAKTLKTPAEVIDNTLSESLEEEKIIWTNLNTLAETLSRDTMIANLKAKGKNYNFNKYPDAQIYRMHQREMNKKAAKSNSSLPEIDTEEEVEYIEPRKCPECDALLNDSGECPRCIHGEEFLTEGVLDKIRSLFNRNNDAVKVNRAALKKRETELQKYIKNISALIAPSYKDTRYTFYRNGKWVDYDTWTAEAPADQFMDNVKNITRIEPNSVAGKVLEAAINVVVRDNDGYVVRRGLENTKFAYNPADPRMLRIPAEYRADQLIGIELKTPTEEPTNSSQPAEAQTATEQTNAPERTVDTKLPTWLKPETIKAATTLLAKRKHPTVTFYTGDGKAIKGRAINMDNVANVYIDKKLKKPFIDVLKEIKDNMVRRKAAVAKSAALFGESLDDDIQIIECNEMTDLDEGLTTAELRDVLELAKAIGIETVEGMEKFSQQEVEPGESILDALKRYRDDLGDDFELIESSPAPLREDFVTKDVLFARTTNNEMRASIEATLNRAASNLEVPEEDLVIFEDKNLDYDPAYYAEGSKQITHTMYKFNIASIYGIEARVAGTILLIFKSKDDADTYIQAVSHENI